jgi:hypothetical protein
MGIGQHGKNFFSRIGHAKPKRTEATKGPIDAAAAGCFVSIVVAGF